LKKIVFVSYKKLFLEIFIVIILTRAHIHTHTHTHTHTQNVVYTV